MRHSWCLSKIHEKRTEHEMTRRSGYGGSTFNVQHVAREHEEKSVHYRPSTQFDTSGAHHGYQSTVLGSVLDESDTESEGPGRGQKGGEPR